MNIRIGLYDFFAYTIPGGMHLFTICYILFRTQIVQINQPLEDFLLSATGVGLVTIACYVSGLIFDFFTPLWLNIFRGDIFTQKIFDEFLTHHKNLDIKFQASDWRILHAKIRQENIELGANIEQSNVTNIMLRNLSFGFFLFALTQAVEMILLPNNLHITFTLLFAVLFLFAQRQSFKFTRLFLIQIFEHTAAKDLSDLKFAEYKFIEEPGPTKHAKS